MSKPKILSVRVERCAHLHPDEWGLIGIVAKASVVSTNGVTQTLRSHGRWNITPCEDKIYFQQVELAALRTELLSFGFGERAIARAFQHVETVNK